MGPNHPFSTRLKTARLAKAERLKALGKGSYSQEKLGVDAGIAEESARVRVHQYEYGKHFPDLAQAQHFADALDIPMAYLFCPEDDLAELLLAASRLDRAGRASLIARARELEGDAGEAGETR